ncbi:serine protein kinase RIO [Ornithinimicrobium pratense]|uniref:non-specific serine/threonine protein kinase n=1 Tax=Ornithinimicrobium pratense TaxID=2593973 RepID=A0A5J6V584_9MICO|nr:RIO1 family regulatory kinase/ATPase [Ornithinimicrobium pratense]QFG68346.1 serine/threonine protein kinase [Ornithinimicrobium pratense]
MPTAGPRQPTGEIDPFFTFDYVRVDQPEIATDGRRATTYWAVDRSSRGPAPVPPWLVVDAGAVDTELGVLKTGKEADVFLVERAAEHVSPVESCLLAVKRYRGAEHSSFHRSSVYVEGRGVRRSRDQRALERGSSYGREVAAGRWSAAEWDALRTAWSAGVAVPYPVSVQGSELMMEFVGSPDGQAAPRLAQVRPSSELLAHCWGQVRAIVLGLAELGWAHGDLSAYNLLLHGEVVLAIDLPQVVDVVSNPRGPELLHRDCVNVSRWFSSRGCAADADLLFAEAVAAAL